MKKVLTAIIIIVVLLIVCFFFVGWYSSTQKSEYQVTDSVISYGTSTYHGAFQDPDPYAPQRVSLAGSIACLPLKAGTTGAQTADCPLSLHAENGNYYILDLNLMSQTPPAGIKTGDRIRGNGVFTPIERLSTDHWQKYNTAGVFSITDSLKIN